MERLGHFSSRVLFQPKLNVCFRPPQVESAPQRVGAEPIDAAAAPGLLISKQPQLGGDGVLKRPCGDRCEIGLDDNVCDGSRKKLSQFGRHRLTRLQGNSRERGHSVEC